MQHRIFMALCQIAIVLITTFAYASEKNWHALFNGQNLDGWQISENTGSAKVVNGAIVCNGPRAHLFYTGAVNNAIFKNFELKADVLTKPGGNSGIYFHTAYQETGWPDKGYEVQINNTYKGSENYRELKKTGSLYAVRNTFKSIARDDVWFSVHIAVRQNRVMVKVNDVLLVDYVQPKTPPRRDNYKGRLLSSGAFALQCHDPDSEVHFKNIMVRPLPDDIDNGSVTPPIVDDYYTQIYELNATNFPIIDSHVHIKRDLSIEDALAKSRRDGIAYTLAPNCGIGFPITDDAGIADYLEKMQDVPVFHGMQAEGREWLKIFSKPAVARFDFVFSDALTFFHDDGRRIQLWKKETVGDIKDKQVFMDMYVDRIQKVILNEPIDVFVNPTLLPEVLRPEHDALWTTPRMQKVIDAIIQNQVAIEINNRYRIPSATFIKMAKQAGAKFTFGTNNTSADDLQRLEYCLDMLRECSLTADDMFMPQPEGKKAIKRASRSND